MILLTSQLRPPNPLKGGTIHIYLLTQIYLCISVLVHRYIIMIHRKEVLQLLTNIQSPKVMEQVLQDLLTPKELAEFGKRIEILRQLQAGVPQRTIAQRLQVGIATVTRGARVLSSSHTDLWQTLLSSHRLS